MTDEKKPEHVFAVTAIQLRDITALVDALGEADKDEETRGVEWGDGFRAVLPMRIPIHTDTRETVELLGWIERGDFGWSFTQIAL
jgi:hypothetical protein